MIGKFLITATIVFTATLAFGQTATDAIITGTVTDSSKSVIEGATVRVADVATGVVTTTATNNHGQYRTSPLQIGSYTVAIESSGFVPEFISTEIEVNTWNATGNTISRN